MIIRDRAELERENAQVLNLVQAMLGGVSPNMRAASLECWPEGVRLHFLLEREDEGDRQEIEDIAFEFEALQDRGINLEVSVVVSPERSAIGKLPGRRVYGRKERWESSPSESA
jgi:hypothetical protein